MAPESEKTETYLDLVLTREIDAPPSLVWKAWTEPENLKQWWAPAPMTTPECELDLRPGGMFLTVMRSPDGTEHPAKGVFLEVAENRRIVFTDALEPGWRPAPKPFFTAVITLEKVEGGTRYTARVLHKNESDRQRHEEMGFEEGWGKCLDQLVEVVARLKDGA